MAFQVDEKHIISLTVSGPHTHRATMQISSYRQQLAFSSLGQNVPTAPLSATIFLCFLHLLLFHWCPLSGAFLCYFLYRAQSLLEVNRCLQRTLALVSKVNSATSRAGVIPGLCGRRLPHQDCPSRGGALSPLLAPQHLASSFPSPPGWAATSLSAWG